MNKPSGPKPSQPPTNLIEFIKSFNSKLPEKEAFEKYSFILGLYLGDGTISNERRTKRMDIYLDKKYNIMNEYIKLQFLKLFGKSPYIIDKEKLNGSKLVQIGIRNKHLDCMFPHTGKGMKHLRKIELQQWQKDIIVPEQIIKGLIYSDGCYFYDKSTNMTAYNFSNCSLDIIEIFKEYLEKLEIRYTCRQRKELSRNEIKGKIVQGKTLGYIVSIYRQASCKTLHSLIGDKNNPI